MTWAQAACIAAMAFVLSIPGSAYHVTPVMTTAPSVTTADFFLGVGVGWQCESEGPGDPVNPAPTPHAGVGSLCYAGRNGASGTAAPVFAPTPWDWTVLDVCNEFHVNTVWGCISDGWTYWAQVGVYGCWVFANPGWADEELIYREDYAWMTWDAPQRGGNGHVLIIPDVTASNFLSAGFNGQSGSYVTKPAFFPFGTPCGSSDPLAFPAGPVGIATGYIVP